MAAPSVRRGAGRAAGGAGRDGGAADAGEDATATCAVAVDGGTAACTTRIVSGNDNDIYCALKADGRLNCWAADGLAFLFTPGGGYGWSDAIATAPPNLVQLSMTNALSQAGVTSSLLCGVDSAGQGSCWGGQAKVMGQGLKAVILSEFGTCTLSVAGGVSCQPQVSGAPPASRAWARILPSETLVAALDVNGAPYYPYQTFPAGTYVDIAANDNQRVGAVRSDGTAVAIGPAGTSEKPGTFSRIAVDYSGRACAIDASGEVTCWAVDSSSSLPALTPPQGPFVQIAGAESTFCAVRTTGTTVCFGDHPISIPAGW